MVVQAGTVIPGRASSLQPAEAPRPAPHPPALADLATLTDDDLVQELKCTSLQVGPRRGPGMMVA